MRDLFIVGAGGFGREAIWTVERINALSQQPQWNIIGYADDDPKWKKGDNFEGFPILGTLEEASRDYPGASVFIAVGKNTKRADIAKRLRGHDFPAIIDPKAQISPTTDFLEGAFIAAGAVVQVGAELGRFVIAGANSVVGHDAKVGDRVSFFANASTMSWITIGEDSVISCGVGVKADLPPGSNI